MPRSVEALRTVLNAKGAAGVDNTIDVSDFRNVVLEVASANNTNATIKVAGSVSATAPDFTAAQSVSNMYDFVESIDLEDGASVPGDTGLAFAAADDFRLLEVNTNNLRFLTVRITTYVAGNITVKAYPQTNA